MLLRPEVTLRPVLLRAEVTLRVLDLCRKGTLKGAWRPGAILGSPGRIVGGWDERSMVVSAGLREGRSD